MRTTPGKIRSHLRQLWLRSKERSATLKRSGYCCEKCGVKQSKKKGFEQKVEVHHLEGILNWNEIIDLILDQLLCDISKLKVLCPECHDAITYSQ